MQPFATPTTTLGITFRLALFYGASFAALGIVSAVLADVAGGRGLSAAQIGVLLAASFWPHIVTSIAIPYLADRHGAHRRLMIGLATVTLVTTALFAVAGPFWHLLLLSMIVGAARAAVMPVGEAMALQEAQAHNISYGRIRLWGSLTFMAAAIGGGLWIERSRPGIVLGLMMATALLTLIACQQMPEYRAGDRRAAPPGSTGCCGGRRSWRSSWPPG